MDALTHILILFVPAFSLSSCPEQHLSLSGTEKLPTNTINKAVLRLRMQSVQATPDKVPHICPAKIMQKTTIRIIPGTKYIPFPKINATSTGAAACNVSDKC